MHSGTLELWLAWFAAHLLGDFVFQTDWIVAHKHRLNVLALHAAMLGALSFVLAGRWSGGAIIASLVLALLHGSIDWTKVICRSQGAKGFVIDQLAHIAVITGLAVGLAPKLPVSHWLEQFGGAWDSGLISVSGLILCINVAGHLIGFAVQPYLDEILQASGDRPGAALDSPARGLTGAGRVIGRWERALIFLFVFVGQPAGIGFLIAAKSIFRFGELKDQTNRREAEYITIGTLMSFGVAMAIAYTTIWLARAANR